jgi:hypothetical protein
MVALFAIAIFAIISQIYFIVVIDEETLVSTPDMRFRKWLGLDRQATVGVLEHHSQQ